MKMSKRRMAAGALFVALGCGATMAAMLPSRAPAREIRLVVRNMAYYVEGETVPNPPLRVRSREKVRVILRNDDPGMTHDFTIAAWNARTPGVETGGEAHVEFRAPAEPGAATYSCTPHGQMMRGALTVE